MSLSFLMVANVTGGGGGGGGGQAIDYTPQLQLAIEKLTEVIADIETHEANTGTRHDEIKTKLDNLFNLGSSYLTLAQQSQATQEQIKAICQQISDAMPGITTAIDGFRSAALDALTFMGNLLQREFDETQAALLGLQNTVQAAALLKELETFTENVTVDCTLQAKQITIPAGAFEVVGYADRPVAFTLNGRSYIPGSQVQHSAVTVGNSVTTYGQQVFEAPAGCKFHVGYRALRALGQIGVVTSTGPELPPDPLDTLIDVPEGLGGNTVVAN